MFPMIGLAQTDTLFEPASTNVVIPRRNWQFTDPGAIFYHDGKFHAFYNSFNNWPGEVSIYYATSEDGIVWVREQNTPVFDEEIVPEAIRPLSLLVTSAFVEDGLWVIYFYTLENESTDSLMWIGRATAPNPVGPWTAHPEPVLSPGEGWDAEQVLSPDVVITDGGYWMYYSGTVDGERAIGRATSEDGINWVRQEQPLFDAALTFPSVWHANVEAVNDGWVMVFKAGEQFLGNGNLYYYATSADGINWDIANTPAITAQSYPQGRVLWFAELVQVEETLYLFNEVGTFDPAVNGQITQVYLSLLQP
jgi:predicted GH43/DUF377 family glycosyl hydrolase